jgi:hypothetical protein
MGWRPVAALACVLLGAGCADEAEAPRYLVVPMPVALPTPVDVQAEPPDWRPCPMREEPEAGGGLIASRVELLDACHVAGYDDLDLDGEADHWEAEYHETPNDGYSLDLTIELGGVDEPLTVIDTWIGDGGRENALRTIEVASQDEDVAAGVARLLVDQRATTPRSVPLALVRAAREAASDVTHELPGTVWVRRPFSFPLVWQRGQPTHDDAGLNEDAFALERDPTTGQYRILVMTPRAVPDVMETSCKRWVVWTSSDAVVVQDRRTRRWAWVAATAGAGVELGGSSRCGGDLAFVLRAPRHGNDVLVLDLVAGRAAILERTGIDWTIDESLRRLEFTTVDGDAGSLRLSELTSLLRRR